MDPIKHSSPRLDVKVTQDVIDTSARKDSSHCMIAEAVALTVPRAKFISVDLATIRFTDVQAGVRYIYLTPRTAQIALLQFDQGETPEAFGFRLHNAHVLLTGRAAQARRATLVSNTAEGTPRSIPIRTDGRTPPEGPLSSGITNRRKAKQNNLPAAPPVDNETDGTGSGSNHNVRTGRRRAFGLRAIIR